MGPTAFTVTWDYRCPFARNACEHLLLAASAGAPWQVRFTPFSLSQTHVEEGQPDVWDDSEKAPGLLAPQVGLVVRDRYPAAFAGVHLDVFAARHDDGLDIREESVLRDVLDRHHVASGPVFADIADGWPLAAFRAEHEESVAGHGVFGVPTIVADGHAAFFRVMHRPDGDVDAARRTVERVLELVLGWPDLNELKRTTIPR